MPSTKPDTLWRYNPVTGYWRPERSDILPENQARYLAIYQESEPAITFVYAKQKPRSAPPRATNR